MKDLMLLLAMSTVGLCPGGIPAFAQHGGGHGAGPGVGPGMDQGRGRGVSPSSKMGDNMETSRAMSKTPEQLLAQNEKLSAKLQALLPLATNMRDAASGFKNLGQFVAAVHVSHNLDIPFFDLKTRMMSGKSLGNAIHGLKPEVNEKEEAKKAHKQAKETVQEASS